MGPSEPGVLGVHGLIKRPVASEFALDAELVAQNWNSSKSESAIALSSILHEAHRDLKRLEQSIAVYF